MLAPEVALTVDGIGCGTIGENVRIAVDVDLRRGAGECDASRNRSTVTSPHAIELTYVAFFADIDLVGVPTES